MKGELVHLSFCQETQDQKGPRKSFCLGTFLISAGEIFPEHMEIQATDTSVELSYMLNIH